MNSAFSDVPYAQLPFHLVLPDLTADELSADKMLTTYNPFKDHRGLAYFPANDHQRSVVMSILHPDLHSLVEEIALCRVLGGAVPHKDHDCHAKINFYLKTGDARTVFFKDPGVDGTSYHNDDRSRIYSIKEHRLRRAGEFTAQPGDVFLLDTSEIHAVMMADNAERHMISISFRANFDTVYRNVFNYAAILPAELRPA